MTIDANFIFSLAAFAVTVGGLCAGYGMLKAKVNENTKENERQEAQIKECATKIEMLAIEKRLDEDRVRNTEQHKEFYESKTRQGERIGAMEKTIEYFGETLSEIKTSLKSIDDKIDKMGRSV
jgi:chromosome segregation ATPase